MENSDSEEPTEEEEPNELQSLEQARAISKGILKRPGKIFNALKTVGSAMGKWAMAAVTAIAAAVPTPVLVGCLGTALLISLIVGGYGCWALRGHLGKTFPIQAGKDNPDLQKLENLSSQPSRVMGYNQVNVMTTRDQEYLQTGEIDERLIKALVYLSQKHQYLRISHIISAYENMKINPEAGSSALVQNISAHVDGLAADIDQIDFVYKVFQENKDCSVATGGLAGDVVFFNDLNEELLRLKCLGDLFSLAKTNTTWNGQPAEGIPIKILYQDPKPANKHAGNEPDPSLNLNPIDQQIYNKVYQPEARRKVHLVISELLQFPKTLENPAKYLVTQLITYSYERDVKPFEDDGTLAELYGANHPSNYGLFAMEESWQNIHIGY